LTIMKKRLCVFVLGAMAAACGGDSPSGPSRRSETFSGSLDDPTICTCGATGIKAFGIDVVAAGRIDASATYQPADAQLVVRVLDQNLNTVFATSTRAGGSASLFYDAVPAKYNLQVFLASDGPRQATFTLSVTHP